MEIDIENKNEEDIEVPSISLYVITRKNCRNYVDSSPNWTNTSYHTH